MKEEEKVAKKVVISPLDFNIQPGPIVESYLKGRLINCLVSKGDSVSILDGMFKDFRFKVVLTEPAGKVAIKNSTKLKLEGSEANKRQKKSPKIHESVFIAEGAKIRGDVQIEEGASIWFNAVIRGDEGKIQIGKFSNIQDCCVIHSDMGFGVEIGNNVSIGHGAVIRGSKIKDNVTIGMNATVMTNSIIGENSIVGANTLITYNKIFPPNSLIIGVPGKIVKEIDENEHEVSKASVDMYKDLVKKYKKGDF